MEINTAVAMKYFQDRHLTKNQAAGIVANLIQESGVNPKAIQPQGPGRGIVQWDARGKRWKQVMANARTSHRSPYNLRVQLDSLWNELVTDQNGEHVLWGLRQTHTATQAAKVFELGYEQSSIPMLKQRARFAEELATS